jgi:SAM-dependent methyltransferase
MAEDHVFPMWLGYLHLNPLRKLTHNPDKILGPYVNEAMTVADVGCAMGFFSLPLAEMVGANGKVICVDIEEDMIRSLEKRAKKAGLSDRIETIICNDGSLCLDDFKGKIDFALAIGIEYEIQGSSKFFSELNQAMKPAGRLLVAQPKWFVSETDFDRTVSVAKHNGFEVTDRPQMKGCMTVLLQKFSNKKEREK